MKDASLRPMEDKRFQHSTRAEKPPPTDSLFPEDWLDDLREEIRELDRLIAEGNALRSLRDQLASASSNRR